MFNPFYLNRYISLFLVNYSNNSDEEERDKAASSDFVLVYEDHEGDRMIVGDVPWEYESFALLYYLLFSIPI